MVTTETADTVDDLYRELAKRHNMPIEVVEKICRSQWDFLSEVFSAGNFKGVRFPGLGIYRVKKKRIAAMHEKWGFEFTQEQIDNAY